MTAVNIPQDYVADWSGGHGTEWAEISPYVDGDPTYTPNPPQPVQVNGEWVARYSQASQYGKIQTMPRFVLSAKNGFDVEIPLTLNAACLNNGQNYYFAAAIYNGEASYFGLYFYHTKGSGGSVRCINCGYGSFETVGGSNEWLVKTAGWWDKGDKVYAKFIVDPVLNQTRAYLRNETNDPGGSYELIHTRYHEEMLATDPRIEGLGGSWDGVDTSANFKWLEPTSLWLSGSSFASNRMEASWNIDLHPISINQYGDNTVIGGAGAWYPWSRMWNPLPSGFNLWDASVDPALLIWAQEASLEPEGLVGGTFTEDIDQNTEAWSGWLAAGSRVVTSPPQSRPGFQIQRVRLYGRKTAPVGSGYLDGTCKVEILDASLQPISAGGVSEWHPDLGPFDYLGIDLSATNPAEVSLRVSLTQNSDYEFGAYSGGWAYGDAITPILFGYLVEGTAPFSPPAGRYSATQTVTLTGEGDIYYTTDGSTPTAASTLYTVPFTVAWSVEPVTVKFIDDTEVVQEATYEFYTPLPADSLTVTPAIASAAATGTLTAQGMGVTPSVASAEATGTLAADGVSVGVSIAAAEAAGVLSAASVSITPQISAAELVEAVAGTVTADSVTLTPSVSAADLVGALAVSGMSLSPSIAAAELVGTIAASSVSVTPSLAPAQATGTAAADTVSVTPSIAPAQLTPVLAGSGSIRSPSGAVLDIRRIDGTPITIRAAA